MATCLTPFCTFFATPQRRSPTPGRLMTWGDGVPATDWALAAEKAGAIGYRVLNGPGSVQGKGGEP